MFLEARSIRAPLWPHHSRKTVIPFAFAARPRFTRHVRIEQSAIIQRRIGVKTTRYIVCRSLGVVALAAVLPVAALGQSTSLTYQGRLDDEGVPANGLYDLRFRLFDAATGGAQVGPSLCFAGVDVLDGLFMVGLDFGQQFGTSAQRHLDVQVRRTIGQPCTDDFGYVLLSPRQQMTAVPFANHALLATQATSAFTMSAADGSPATAVFVDNNGKVGVGTLAPTHSVHIAGAEPTLALQDTDSTTSQVGYLSYRDSGNVERGWIGYGAAGDPDLSIINARTAGDIVLNTLGGGRVGIGTSTPAVTLDVRGDIRFGTSGQFRAAGGDENRFIRDFRETRLGS